MLQHLVDTYQCEWAAVVRDPEKRKWFRQFANTDETESCIEIVSERGQNRPADWPSEVCVARTVPNVRWQKFVRAPAAARTRSNRLAAMGAVSRRWLIFLLMAARQSNMAIVQIAVFNFSSRG